MSRTNINDLATFVAVAKDQSFTRAAAKLGVTASALSHTIKGLEERLGVRLLARTTRSVMVTEAGARLLDKLAPMFDEIERELASLGELRERPAGTVRITADEHAASFVLWPALRNILSEYPDIQIEIVNDYGMTDIVTDRLDAGVRLGGEVAKDMIALPLGPDMRMMTVASPAYFTGRAKPKVPQDLTGHNCINLRLPTYGGLYAWEFEKRGREMKVRVEGQLIFNSVIPILRAAREGFGIAYLPDTQVRPLVELGELEEVLEDWSTLFPGYYLYYPSRRQPTPAFRVVVDALRYR